MGGRFTSSRVGPHPSYGRRSLVETRRRLVGAAVLAVVSFSSAAGETDRCAALTALAAHATDGNVETQTLSDLTTRLDAEDCGTALTNTGAREIHCRWSFDYRSEQAIAMQDGLASDIARCLPAQPARPERGVNHPDTFEQRVFQAGNTRFSLSLKDKAALMRSYVFLRVER